MLSSYGTSVGVFLRPSTAEAQHVRRIGVVTAIGLERDKVADGLPDCPDFARVQSKI